MRTFRRAVPATRRQSAQPSCGPGSERTSESGCEPPKATWLLSRSSVLEPFSMGVPEPPDVLLSPAVACVRGVRSSSRSPVAVPAPPDRPLSYGSKDTSVKLAHDACMDDSLIGSGYYWNNQNTK
ncbi:uncharacterized protein LOC125941349 [Dermacentor silvarum]|uniref:uncharacterized protein LOC125941349 n=1 Tax=Dermacentor silvarum TaxID=543639 RepID=UPI0021017A6E|nr:uncharacterized protein LOC125941349 [Dermacentor silvarum]